MAEKLTPEMLENFYILGYQAYQIGNFKVASEYFRILKELNPAEVKYWKGLAGAMTMLKDFQGAFETYSIAALIDDQDPMIPWHAAHCLMSLKDYPRALKALKAAELLCLENPKFNTLKLSIQAAYQTFGKAN